MQIRNGKECGVCKGKGFYKCKLCKGKSTIEWSPLYDPIVINPCLCPTCDGNKLLPPFPCFSFIHICMYVFDAGIFLFLQIVIVVSFDDRVQKCLNCLGDCYV